MFSEKGKEITRVALDHFEHLPSHGKPQVNEWSVYAAIVVTEEHSSKAWVASCATGTKCTAIHQESDGNVLHDSHAEVLARRGLILALWLEIQEYQQNKVSSAPRRRLLVPDINSKFRLREGVQLHLYVSDSPCGDSSIYGLDENKSSRGQPQFTGAKILVSDKESSFLDVCSGCQQVATVKNGTNNSILVREDIQLLGKLRSKSGRSNLDPTRRSTSMSCSDKILRWLVFGLQGRVLRRLLSHNIQLSSIIVSRDPRCSLQGSVDPQQVALHRSFRRRLEAVVELLTSTGTREKNNDEFLNFGKQIALPELIVVESTFAQGKTMIESEQAECTSRKRPREDDKKQGKSGSVPSANCTSTSAKTSKRRHSPCGISINWQYRALGMAKKEERNGATTTPQVEITVGARGCRQGKKPKSPEQRQTLASRLSPRSIATISRNCVQSFFEQQSCSERSSRDDLPASLDPANSNAVNQVQAADSRLSAVTYFQEFKDMVAPKDRIRCVLLEQRGPLSGWLQSSDDFDLG